MCIRDRKIKIPGSKDLKNIKKKVTATKVAIKSDRPVIKPAPKKAEVIAKKEKSWFKKLISWDKKTADEESEEIEEIEDKAEEKKSEIASKLVSLNHYKLDLISLSENLYEIKIETDETLGHYSDWSLTRARKIRSTNRMRRNSNIRIGQRFKLILSEETKKRFIANRAEYHLSIQEDFYQAFTVSGSQDYHVRAGDNLSQILSNSEVPLWLFRQFQDKSFNFDRALSIGQVLKIPQVEKREN